MIPASGVASAPRVSSTSGRWRDPARRPTPHEKTTMPRHRPTSVLVIAILHLVGAALLLLGVICGAAGQAVMANMKAPGGGPDLFAQQKAMADAIPGFTAFNYAQMGISLLIGIALLVAGVGLLSMKPWARTLSIVYAAFSILNHLAELGYQFAVVVPNMDAAMQKMFEGDPNLKAAGASLGGFGAASAVVGALFGAALMAYPIAVWIVMTRPAVVAAFRGEVPPEQREPQDYWDTPRERPDEEIRRSDEGFTEKGP